MLTKKLEKSAFFAGELEVTTSSNSWRVMQDTKVVKTEFILSVGAQGGSSVVNVIRNGDLQDIVATATFDGTSGLILSDASEISLSAGDALQVVVPQVAPTAGTDLLVQFLYYSV